MKHKLAFYIHSESKIILEVVNKKTKTNLYGMKIPIAIWELKKLRYFLTEIIVNINNDKTVSNKLQIVKYKKSFSASLDMKVFICLLNKLIYENRKAKIFFSTYIYWTISLMWHAS